MVMAVETSAVSKTLWKRTITFAAIADETEIPLIRASFLLRWLKRRTGEVCVEECGIRTRLLQCAPLERDHLPLQRFLGMEHWGRCSCSACR